MKESDYLDMTGKPLEDGHIVAVRYVWNSYIGEVNFKFGGLHATGAKRFAFFSPHSIRHEHTYQILGHIDKNHSDYNEDIMNWYKSEECECPIRITIYDKKEE